MQDAKNPPNPTLNVPLVTGVPKSQTAHYKKSDPKAKCLAACICGPVCCALYAYLFVCSVCDKEALLETGQHR